MIRFADVDAERRLRTYLTLSAAGERRPEVDGARSAPAEAALRDERDPLTEGLLAELTHYTEAELRALWGDR